MLGENLMEGVCFFWKDPYIRNLPSKPGNAICNPNPTYDTASEVEAVELLLGGFSHSSRARNCT